MNHEAAPEHELRVHPADDPLSPLRDRLAAVHEQVGLDLTVVILPRADNYGRARALLGVTLGLAGGVATWLLLPEVAAEPDSWAGFTPGAKAALAAASSIVLVFVGMLLAGYVPALARPFLSRREIDHALLRAAAPLQPQLLADLPHDSTRPTAPPPPLLLLVARYERRCLIAHPDPPAADHTPHARALRRLAKTVNHQLLTQPPLRAVESALDRWLPDASPTGP